LWKLEVKRPLGKLRRRWEDKIKMDILELEWGKGGGMFWTDLTHDGDWWRALTCINAVMTCRVS
jgi:hypothetical protein